MSKEKVNENPLSMMTGAPCTEDEMNKLDITQIAVDVRPWTDGVEIFLRGENRHLSIPGPERKVYHATGLRIVEVMHTEEAYPHDAPAFSLPHVIALELMTKLWQLGYRPATNLVSSASELEAVNKHLEDMRTLVFDNWLGTEKESENVDLHATRRMEQTK